jgi:hypothetical protein
LGDQDSLSGSFDEVVGTDICHDLCAWQDFDMELLFDPMELLEWVSWGNG